jgi:hypothetical protein
MTVAITEHIPDVAEPVAGRTLIPAEDFDRLVTRTVAKEGIDAGLATAAVDQALAFVATLATRPDVHIGPSASVDIGWHALLHGDTRVYRALCQRLGHTFIDHVPEDADDHDLEPGEDTDNILSRTANAIAAAGYAVDPYMWGVAYAKTHGTYVSGCTPDDDSGSGCHCGNAC